MSGKTTLAMWMAKDIRSKTGRPILVLDPYKNPDWQADFITNDVEKFKEFAKANRSCQLFIDESGRNIGRYAGEMSFFATESRHYGHVSTFISQRAQQIDRNVRDQCTRLFLFSITKKDAEVFADDWVDDSLRNAYLLSQGECLAKLKFKPVVKINAFNLAKSVP